MEKTGGMHEQFDKRDEVKAPSERSFGITFAAVFALLGSFSYWHRGISVAFYVVVVLSVVVAIVTAMTPRLLRPLNLVWLKFGLLLHKVVNPVIMGLLFFGVFTPMGTVMRAVGTDLLRLKRKSASETYWIVKGDESIPNSSMKNQF